MFSSRIVWTLVIGLIFAASGVSTSRASGLIPDSIALFAPCVSGEKTWDGEGVTNNWSEPANWTCDALPTVFESAIFDGTSTKDATIDVNFNRVHIKINTGYTGTITTSSTLAISLDQFTQNTGTFVCGAGGLTTQSNGAITVNAGSFDCSSSTIDSPFGRFFLNGGTFEMPTTTFILGAANGGGFLQREAAATLHHNNGTFVLRQATLIFNGPVQDFKNVTVDTAGGSVGSPFRILGDLQLLSGMLRNEGPVIDVLGSVTVSTSYGAGGFGVSAAILNFIEDGSTPNPRTITIPGGTPTPFHKFTLNAPNTTIRTTGTDQVIFPGITLISGTVEGTGAPIQIQMSQSAGTFICGGGLITTISNNTLGFSGGTFDCTTSNIDSGGATFDLTGGTFKMPAGTFSLGTTSQSQFKVGNGAVLEHNNGLFDLRNAVVNLANGAGTRDFNNVTTSLAIIEGTLRTLGTLNLETGAVRGGILEAPAAVNVSDTYGQNPNGCCVENHLRLVGNAVRTVTFPASMQGRLQALEIDAPNTTVKLSGTGTAPLSGVTLNRGRFETGTTALDIRSVGFGATVNIIGGTFVCGGGLVTLGASLTQTGGIFDCGASDMNITDPSFVLTGGTFTAPSGTMSLNGTRFEKNAASTFDHNNGTLLATGAACNMQFSGGGTSIDLNNLTVNLNSSQPFNSGGTVRVLGDMQLQNGSIRGLTFEAHKNVTISPTFEDNNDFPASVVFAGGNAQTFTNNGGANPRGSWVVNKTAGSTLTIASDLIQTLLFSQLAPLTITSGNVYLADGSDLTIGNLTIGSNGKLINDSSTTITLQGNVSNSGVIDLQGGGAGCPEPDSIMIRSSIDGTPRTWSGSGSYLLTDVDVKDMGGPTGGGNTLKRVFSGTNSGNVDASWVFAGGCPGALSISPQTVNLDVGQTQTFTAGGGAPPYTFSIPTNNSGATIDPSSGIYTSGNTPSVIDTVRVTDDAGATADATVNLAAGCVPGQKTWDGGGTTNNWSEAANWTCNTVPSGSDKIIFDNTSSKNVAVDITVVTGAPFEIRSGYTGTLLQGSSSMTFNGAFSQAAGTFDGGSGTMAFNASFVQSGGTFNATSGTATYAGSVFERGALATFNHNNGSVVFAANSIEVRIVSGVTATQDFGNLTISTPGGLFGSDNDTLRVNGTLDLNNGAIFSMIIEARGPVNVANTLGNGTDDPGAGRILFSGPATRTITLPVLAGAYNALELNAPNTTVNLSGTGQAKLTRLDLLSGTFNAGNTSVRFHRPGNGQSTQSGGVFDCGTGTITYAFGTFTQTGGSYNCQNATIDSTTDSGLQVFLNGGTFNAPAGTMTFNGGIFERGVSGTFNHDNGTVIFGGNSVEVRVVNGATATQDLGNLTLAAAAGLFGSDNDLLRVNGNLTLGGQALSVNFEAHGNVTVQSGFSTNTSTHLTFAGLNAQTYTNNGGTNPSGNFVINKPSGTVTATTSLSLGTTQPLSITSGTLYLNENSNLTTGALSVGANGKLVNDSVTTITLGGNVSNSGVIDLQGGGAGCPENDTILVRSTDTTQRTWTGTGRYRLVDVDVQRMGGSGTKNVFSGTDSGNNNASWTFSPNCPTDLSITPLTAGVQTGTQRQFTAGGGFTPYIFSLAVNNSGGSINPTTGVYTAGTIAGVTDTIRVTDAFGSTADATATTFGSANKLSFSVQPTNAVAGVAITPAIQVTVQDQFGNTVTNSSAQVTMSLAANPGSGNLTGTLPVNAVNGIATFSDLSINRPGSGYTLRAASVSLANATSSTFDIAVGAAHHLGFNVNPSNGTINTAIAPPIQVTVLDASNNQVTSSTAPISLTLSTNPTGATLGGTNPVNAIAGQANFTDITVNRGGTGYRMTANSPGLTGAVSTQFSITDPFVVTNTNDSGAGSLRQIITAANAAAGVQVISFNIPGPAPHSIPVATNLPDLTDAVLDGTTQPGFSGVPIVELTKSAGSTAAYGLLVRRSVVKGLVIGGFPIGLRITSSFVSTPSGTLIQGNYIGTNPGGTAAHGNTRGITAESGDFTIDGNLISGNQEEGISVQASTPPTANLTSVIKRNLIGSDATGLNAIPNNSGIRLTPGVLGSVFGRTVIGGSQADSNLIAFNTRTGVLVRGFDKASIIANRIHSNGFLGIDLKTVADESTPEVTRNDTRDADVGANQLQNFPVLTAATTFNGSTAVTGSLSSTPSRAFRLDFYSSSACDPSTYGEGEVFLGTANVSTDSTGLTGFSATLPVAPAVGRFITATATDPDGNTSEFSQCRNLVAATFSISGRIVDGGGAPVGGATVRFQGSRASTVTDSNGNYIFNSLPAGVDYTLTPSKPNTSFSPASITVNNLSANTSNQNFTATLLATIRGNVTSSVNGVSFALSQVAVNLTGPINATTSTDINGTYAFLNLPPGNYTATPSRDDFTFSPAAANVSLAGTTQTVNFVGQTPSAPGRIIANRNGTIESFNPDASGLVSIRAATNHAFNRSVLSPDGRRIAYIDERGSTTNALGKMNFDGTQPSTFLVSSTQSRFSSIAWSPDSTKLAYVQGNKDIRTTDLNGISQQTILIGNNDPIGTIDWSPDGTKIAFSRLDHTTGQMSIFLVSATTFGGGVQLVATGAGPRFSPDGQKIAYINGQDIFTIKPDGTQQALLLDRTQPTYELDWSPDGSTIAFSGDAAIGTRLFEVAANGTNAHIISGMSPFDISWGPAVSTVTPSGSNVGVSAGGASVTFSSVTGSGTTTITPISAGSAGTRPGGYVLAGMAYEISTTANVTPPITVCFNVPSSAAPTQAAFNLLSILHNENGVLVDRTVSRTFSTRTICAQTTSLSPFALGLQIDPSLPQISGVVLDPNGDPMVDVEIRLSGAEDRVSFTDSSGEFHFADLELGSNYVIEPKKVGYLFSEGNEIVIGISGERTFLFESTAVAFDISGHVTNSTGDGLSGILVTLSGSDSRQMLTDAQGAYIFAGLPADGLYNVWPSDGANAFSPAVETIDPLASNATDVDFAAISPTAASLSISGNVVNVEGRGIRSARVQAVGSNGVSVEAVSGRLGSFRLDGLEAGQTYVLRVNMRRFSFAPQLITLSDDITGLRLVAIGH